MLIIRRAGSLAAALLGVCKTVDASVGAGRMRPVFSMTGHPMRAEAAMPVQRAFALGSCAACARVVDSGWRKVGSSLDSSAGKAHPMSSRSDANEKVATRRRPGSFRTRSPGRGPLAMMMVSNRKPNPNPSPTNQAGQKQLKQHMCIVFGYCGTNYYGLQSQQAEGDPEHPTVSDVLRQAFLKSGAIAPSNFVPLHRTKWRIASRTDKGVHAALAAVSFKMETWPEQLEDPKALTPPTHHSSGGGAARAIAGASGGAGGGDGGAGGGGGVQAVASSLVKPTEVQLSQAEIARINGYLPNDVRLLGAARVRGAFEPRECASSRSYE
eukprot:5466470-Pleurochrysis_carterae.AAC.2